MHILPFNLETHTTSLKRLSWRNICFSKSMNILKSRVALFISGDSATIYHHQVFALMNNFVFSSFLMHRLEFIFPGGIYFLCRNFWYRLFAGFLPASPGVGAGPNCSGTGCLVTERPNSFSILSNLYCSLGAIKV